MALLPSNKDQLLLDVGSLQLRTQKSSVCSNLAVHGGRLEKLPGARAKVAILVLVGPGVDARLWWKLGASDP